MENNNDLMSVLKILDDEGILKDAILIGSWSLIFYQEIFENFSPLIRTTDIDFYIPNVKKIKEKNNLIGSFKINNYDIVHDSLTNKSTFISPDGFEID